VRPFPKTSQANPNLGLKFLSDGFVNSGPSIVLKSVTTFRRPAMIPWASVQVVIGSYRIPRFNVSLGVTRSPVFLNIESQRVEMVVSCQREPVRSTVYPTLTSPGVNNWGTPANVIAPRSELRTAVKY
jgi:hypothetical protein